MKVVLVGGGGMGLELARVLTKHGHTVALIEADGPRSEFLAGELDALVLHGDGTDPALLDRAGLARADALVAVTGSDALNTVVAMLGKRLQVSRVIVKLNGVGLHPACAEIGVDAIVAPKLAAAGQVLSVLSGFDRLDFSVAARGGLSLIELNVGKVERTLDELQVPGGVLVVLVIRGEQVLMPRGSTRLQERDLLLTLVEDPAAAEAFKAVLAGAAD